MKKLVFFLRSSIKKVNDCVPNELIVTNVENYTDKCKPSNRAVDLVFWQISTFLEIFIAFDQ